MATVSTYLNFPRNTEEAFNFYRSVFGTEFHGPVFRFEGIPPQEGMPPIAESDKNLVMHIALPILGGHMLMGTDAPESMGFTVNKGNNVYISLHPNSKKDADDLFNKLSAGGEVEMPMADQFWGDYFGSFKDKFGIGWMINYNEQNK
jgi:PhnB protein